MFMIKKEDRSLRRKEVVSDLLNRFFFSFIAFFGYAGVRAIQGAFLSSQGEDVAAAMALINALVMIFETSSARVTIVVGMDLAKYSTPENKDKFGLAYAAGKYNSILSSLIPIIFTISGVQNQLFGFMDVNESVNDITKKYFQAFSPSLLAIMLLYSEKQVFWVLEPKTGLRVDLSYISLDLAATYFLNKKFGYIGIGIGMGVSTIPVIIVLELIFKINKKYAHDKSLSKHFSFSEIFKKMKEMFPKGMSFFLQTFINSLSTVSAKLIMTSVGSRQEIVAVGISAALNSLAGGAGEAMGYAAIPLFARALQKLDKNKDNKLADLYLNYANLTGIAIPLCVLALSQVIPKQISDIYVNTDNDIYKDVPEIAQHYFLIEGITFIFRNIRIISSNLCRTAGDDKFVTIANIAPMVLNLIVLFSLFVSDNINVDDIYYLQLAESLMSAVLVYSRGRMIISTKDNSFFGRRSEEDKSMIGLLDDENEAGECSSGNRAI